MQSRAVVEAHNVVSDISHGFCVVGIVLLPEPLHLQVHKETLQTALSQQLPLQLILPTRLCFSTVLDAARWRTVYLRPSAR